MALTSLGAERAIITQSIWSSGNAGHVAQTPGGDRASDLPHWYVLPPEEKSLVSVWQNRLLVLLC